MYEDVSYKKSYLTEVIARVDWLNPIQEIDRGLPKEIQRAIKPNFSIAEPRKLVLQQVKLSLGETVQSKEIESTEWNFHSKDRTKTLTIIPDAMFVRYLAYENFEILKEEFTNVLGVFYKHFENAQANRLGLRYVNNIVLDEGNPLNWQQYINDRLLSLIGFYPNPYLLARVFHILELNFGDSNLRFQFGMHNPDFPAAIRRKIFTLDLDAYYQGIQDKDELLSNLDVFHQRIQEIFEMSIKDDLRRKMNESD